MMLLRLATLLLCLLSAASAVQATEPTPEEQMKSYHDSILDVEGSIAVARGEDNQFKREEERILHQIRQLDARLEEHQTKLRALRKDVERHRLATDRLETESTRLRNLRRREEKLLQQRITAFYKMGRIGMLNATFSSRSLPDLITFNNSFEELVQFDKKLISAYEDTLKLQEESRGALKKAGDKLTLLLADATAEEQKVSRSRTEMEEVLKGVQGRRSLRRKTIRRLRKDSRRLTKALAGVKDTLLRREKAFLKSKGELPMPAEGEVVTRFHQWQENRFGEKERSEGIEIEVPDGSPVRAIGSGKVIYAGYFEGLGNTVIINHGSRIYSVTARLESVSAEVGKSIPAETIIGTAGDAATLFTNGIYFEIRKGERQVDPLKWLDRDQVVFKKSKS